MTKTIVTGTIPSIPTTFMEYGNGDDRYEFDPVPLVTLEKRYDRTGDNERLSPVYRITLNGSLICLSGGLSNVMDKQRELREAFDADGKYFVIKSNNDVLLECYPSITTPIRFTHTGDNWYQRTDYTIELEFYDEPVQNNIDDYGEDHPGLVPPYLRSADEQWQIDFVEDASYHNRASDIGNYQFRVSHTVSAVGKRRYIKSGASSELDRPAWQWARDWVTDQLGITRENIVATGVLNINATNLNPYNHIRQENINEKNGSYSVTESWLALKINSSAAVTGAVVEDFNVSVNSGIGQLVTVNVQGNIQGMSEHSYGTASGDFTIKDRYRNASGYWKRMKTADSVLGRAQSMAGMTLKTVPLSSSVAHSFSRGTIDYAYAYDNRPTTCVTLDGIISESITITDNDQTDVFASQMVLGRTTGPILQDINTKTAKTKEVSVELLMKRNNACNLTNSTTITNAVETDVIDPIETALNTNDRVFKTQDVSSWDPRGGRYSRQVAWTYGSC